MNVEQYDEMCFDFKVLVDQFQQKYKQIYQSDFDFLKHFEKKLNQSKENKYLIIYHELQPVGFCFFEKISAFYGALTFFVVQKKWCNLICKVSVEYKYFDDFLMEIICYEYEKNYRKNFKQYGLIENFRQRMRLALYEDEYFSEMPTPYFTKPLCKQDLYISSKLSFLAHQVSRDYYMYPGMNDLDNRLQLEQFAFDGLYGTLNQDASFFICKQDRILGYCLVVNVDCWGERQVPWIFDISVLPEYQGQGIGRLILHQLINTCVMQKKTQLGLAVTISNKNAIHLYESVGFQFLSTFYEYIKKVS